jgi:hypothetical protein
MVSEVSVHDHLVPLFVGYSEEELHGRRHTLGSRAAHLMVARKERVKARIQ